MNDKQFTYLQKASRSVDNDRISFLSQRAVWDEIYAELQRLAWMPIETAPDDGDPFLVNNSPVCVAFKSWCYHTKRYYVSDYKHNVLEPTHWMPLPPTPKEGEL